MFCWLTHLRIFCKYQLSIQKMYIAVTSFNILCCSKCRFFTHSTVWWNPRNTLITTFIHRNVSVYKLKTIEFSLVFLWMFFKITFSRPHVWGRTWLPCSPCSASSSIRNATCSGVEAVVWGNVGTISPNIEYNLVYSFCFTCYEHMIWTYTWFKCLSKLLLNLLILKMFLIAVV